MGGRHLGLKKSLGKMVLGSTAPLPAENPLATLPCCPGAMSLAGAQGSLWSVEGGNKLVCSGLLKLTKANVIHATVTSVGLFQTGEWTHQGHYSIP